MTQLWAWKYEGKTEVGIRLFVDNRESFAVPVGDSLVLRNIYQVTNIRKAKVADEDVATKTYLTTDQFIKVWKSLDESKQKELHAARDAVWLAAWHTARNAARDAVWLAAWHTARNAARNAAWNAAWYAAWYAARYAAWYAARNADLAIVVRDKITPDQFNILVQPWTSCGLSLYAEDWDEVLNPKVTEPKGFGAIVEASSPRAGAKSLWLRIREFRFEEEMRFVWENPAGYREPWENLFNPIIISEGVEG